MIAFFYFVLRLARKEKAARRSYHREHPNFTRILIIDAVITTIVATGIFSFALIHVNSATRDNFENAGVRYLSAAELISHEAREDKQWKVFWVGPREGNIYELHGLSENEERLTYRVLDQPLMPQANLFSIESYANKDAFDEEMQPLSVAQSTDLTTSKKRTISYNTPWNDYVLVKFPDSPQLVLIHVPILQTDAQLMTLADQLTPIA